MLNIKNEVLSIILSSLLLINPYISFYISFPLFIVINLFIFRKDPSSLIYVVIFFSSLSIPVRWSMPTDYLAASFRDLLILFVSITILIGWRFKFSISYGKNALLLILAFTLLTVFLVLYRWESTIYSIFVIREYIIVSVFYPIVLNALRLKEITFKNILLFYLLGLSLASFINLLVYFQIINFPFDAITYNRNGLEPAVRNIFGIDIIRMGSTLGISTGGAAILYTSATLLGLAFYYRSRTYIYKILFSIIFIVNFIATIFLISFSTFIVIIAFIVSILIVKYHITTKRSIIMVFPMVIIILFFFNIISINGYQWIDNVAVSYKLTLLDYTIHLFNDFIKPLFSNLHLVDYFTGIAFDVKTGYSGITTRTIPRDFGIFSAFASHGILGLIIVFLMYYTGLSKINRTIKRLVKDESFMFIIILTMFISSFFFLHGLVITTRPIDSYFMISYIGLIYYKELRK